MRGSSSLSSSSLSPTGQQRLQYDEATDLASATSLIHTQASPTLCGFHWQEGQFVLCNLCEVRVIQYGLKAGSSLPALSSRGPLANSSKAGSFWFPKPSESSASSADSSGLKTSSFGFKIPRTIATRSSVKPRFNRNSLTSVRSSQRRSTPGSAVRSPRATDLWIFVTIYSASVT